MINLNPIAELLDHLGVKHAPEQYCTDEPHVLDGRYVTLLDPPAVYYILGTDNREPGKETEEVQLIFLDHIGKLQENISGKVDHCAGSIGYRVKDRSFLPSDNGPIPSVILEPKFPQVAT